MEKFILFVEGGGVYFLSVVYENYGKYEGWEIDSFFQVVAARIGNTRRKRKEKVFKWLYV